MGGVGKGDTKALSERVAAMPAFAPGGRLEGSGSAKSPFSSAWGVRSRLPGWGLCDFVV